MSRFQKIELAGLIVIAGASVVSAVEVSRIASEGMSMELTVEDAQEVANNVNEILAARDSSLAGWEGSSDD